jgi:hypothetical protein
MLHGNDWMHIPPPFMELESGNPEAFDFFYPFLGSRQHFMVNAHSGELAGENLLLIRCWASGGAPLGFRPGGSEKDGFHVAGICNGKTLPDKKRGLA